jgi:hypothetical protein
MAPGSIHPSGERYTVLFDNPIAPVPDWVRGLRAKKKERVIDPLAPITEWRNDTLYRVLCKHRANGADDEMLRDFALRAQARMPDPLDEEELERIIANACKQPIGGDPEAGLVPLGKKLEPPLDWRAKYHTLEDFLNVPPGKFLVDGILFEGSITALAGYAGDRKSIVSLNLAAACVTGEPFMGRFAVANKPTRVLYLCPEMGLRELKKFAENMGMMPHVRKSLFFRSLDMDGRIKLNDLTPEELRGSLVILDTAVRFIEGSENDPQDMAAFADELFRLRHDGATVWVLFHSSKASAGQDLSLQNALRGSSELAAMLSMCWATRLNDSKDRYGSTSTMYPMKVREFEALSFEFACNRATAVCTILGEPACASELKDRKDTERKDNARDLMQKLLASDPAIGINKIRKILTAAKCGKNQEWVMTMRSEILGTGVTLTSS